MELHKWDLTYDNKPINTLTGAASFSCSCTLVMSGPREEILRLMYDHLPRDWWPVWTDRNYDDSREGGQVP